MFHNFLIGYTFLSYKQDTLFSSCLFYNAAKEIGRHIYWVRWTNTCWPWSDWSEHFRRYLTPRVSLTIGLRFGGPVMTLGSVSATGSSAEGCFCSCCGVEMTPSFSDNGVVSQNQINQLWVVHFCYEYFVVVKMNISPPDSFPHVVDMLYWS